MSGFKVGEVAIGKSFVNSTHRNGMECEIIGGMQESGVCLCEITRATIPSRQCYYVRWADGLEGYVAPANLRKRRPSASDESAHRQAMLDCIERAKRVSEVAYADQA